jgi:hypothetical protein
MSKSISEINDRLKELNKKYKKSGLTDGKISHKAAMASLKGNDRLKMSDEAKKEISKRLKGKPKSKAHKENLKKKKLKYKITKQEILNAQNIVLNEKGVITAKDVAAILDIDVHTYRGIATYHNCYKKQSLSERNTSKADIIDVWEYNPDFKLNRGKYIGRMSKPDARNNLGINNMNKFFDGTYAQVNGYVLEKIK